MLFRKLIRTMGRYRAQFISMIIMIALGIGVFVGFNIEWYTIETDTNKLFSDTGFSDYRIVSEKGWTESDRDAVADIDGVSAVTRYLSVNTTVKGSDDVVAVNVCENIEVSGFIVTSGAGYDPESSDGMWLSDKYAEANGISLGDSLTLTYKGIEITGRVEGLIKSGEYLICVPDPTQLMPDYDTYGYAYITPVMLNEAFGVEMYTQINVLSGLEKTDFVERADEALGVTALVIFKDDTISYSEAMGESKEGKTMVSVLPVLFLAIAVLTMVTTMHRLTASEKTQIGTLKSLGFKDRRITLHYTSYALFIGVLGTLLGIGIGWVLGWFIMNPGGPMGTYIDMQDWSLHAPGFTWILLAAINLLLVFIGFLSVSSMLKGNAADALRPYTPKKVRRLFLERFRLWDKLGFGTKWNLRDTFRHKARSGMALIGIVGCMVLLVGSFGMNDTLDYFVDVFFDDALDYETKINLDVETTTNAEAAAIAREYDGDWLAQSSVQIEDKSVGLEIYYMPHGMIRFPDKDMQYSPLPSDGAVICQRIADEFGVAEGGTLTFSPFGSDREYTVTVKSIVRSLSESVIMSSEYADAIGAEYSINCVYTRSSDIKNDPHIVNSQPKKSIVDSFDSFMQVMITMVILLVVAAVILGIVVLYNLGVMSYTERYREMATLKVLGFKDNKIGRLLISQNLWLTVVGVLIGLPLGYLTLDLLVVLLASEYEMSLSLGWMTYVFSILLTFGTSTLVGFMVSRKNKKIDMVEALKTPE